MAGCSSYLSTHRRELGGLVELLPDEETVDGAAVYGLVGKPVPTAQGGATMAPRRVAAASGSGDGPHETTRPALGEDHGHATSTCAAGPRASRQSDG